MNLGLRIGAIVSFATDPQKMIHHLEESGIDSFWMYEIFQGYEAFARAGYIAALSSRARISVGVVNSYSRHPALTAMGGSFLANMTQGRANLLLGVGGDSWVGGVLGYEQSKPLQRFKEFVTVVRQLLHGEEVNHQTDNFVLNKVKLEPKPAYPVPIIVACEQPAMMKLAGRLADGVYLEPSCCPTGYLKWAVQTVRESSDKKEGFRVVANMPLRVTDDIEKARSSIKMMLAFHLSFPGEGELYLEKAGFHASLAEDIGRASGVRRLLQEKRNPLEAFEAGTVKKATPLIPDEFADQCAVIGNLETCRNRLRELERAWLTDIVFSFESDQPQNIGILARTLNP